MGTFAARSTFIGLFVGLGFLAPFGAMAQDEPTAWELRVCAERDHMPYSNEQAAGFENAIAELVAQDVHAELTYVWLPRLRHAEQDLLLLREGRCDVFLDIGNGRDPYLPTIDYYQSTYVFVYRAGMPDPVESLDDLTLPTLQVGVVAASPPDTALGVRGLQGNLHHYYPGLHDPTESMLDDVVAGKIDVAVLWGPVAAYYVPKRSAALEMTPVLPQVDAFGMSMVYTTAMGVRAGDEELRDLLNHALAREWDEIGKVLGDYGIPIVPLPVPVVSIGDE